MTLTSLKIAGLSIIAVGLTAGAAYAGGGKDCKDKSSASHASMTSTPATAVLPASTRADATTHSTKKAYTFDQALEACTAKGAADLQACIDYKTGKTTAKPQS